jgi:hypothetical protein
VVELEALSRSAINTPPLVAPPYLVPDGLGDRLSSGPCLVADDDLLRPSEYVSAGSF